MVKENFKDPFWLLKEFDYYFLLFL